MRLRNEKYNQKFLANKTSENSENIQDNRAPCEAGDIGNTGK